MSFLRSAKKKKKKDKNRARTKEHERKDGVFCLQFTPYARIEEQRHFTELSSEDCRLSYKVVLRKPLTQNS